MAKAFWLFSKNAGDGSEENINRPSLDGIGGRWTSPGDLVRFTGPAAAPHVHLLVGGIALPDDNLGVGHRHYFVKVGESWQQVTVGGVGHSHDIRQATNGDPIPDWYLVFWHGSNAEAAAIAADSDNHPLVEASILEDGSVGELVSEPWSVEERVVWESRALALLGLELPAEVDRGSRMLKLFLGALLSRQTGDQTGDERGYRFS
jgi:hypothetical protein